MSAPKQVIREIIVVEGKNDVAAVRRAVDAVVLTTGGHGFGDGAMKRIRAAHERQGIVVLTDPDHAGERIRRRITAEVGPCKHAYLSREEATGERIGVEYASADAIRKALERARVEHIEARETFVLQDLHEHGLVGHPDSTARRAALCEALGLGPLRSARQLLRKLNRYGISREEFDTAVVIM